MFNFIDKEVYAIDIELMSKDNRMYLDNPSYDYNKLKVIENITKIIEYEIQKSINNYFFKITECDIDDFGDGIIIIHLYLSENILKSIAKDAKNKALSEVKDFYENTTCYGYVEEFM